MKKWKVVWLTNISKDLADNFIKNNMYECWKGVPLNTEKHSKIELESFGMIGIYSYMQFK